MKSDQEIYKEELIKEQIYKMVRTAFLLKWEELVAADPPVPESVTIMEGSNFLPIKVLAVPGPDIHIGGSGILPCVVSDKPGLFCIDGRPIDDDTKGETVADYFPTANFLDIISNDDWREAVDLMAINFHANLKRLAADKTHMAFLGVHNKPEVLVQEFRASST